MNSTRRRLVRLAPGAALLPLLGRRAFAQAYPSRPVRWIVPFPPGGGTDVLARAMGEWLAGRLGQPFVIENRPGAGANIGTEAAVHAPADGHTLLLAASVNAINATLYGKLPFDFSRDIAPVAAIVRLPNIMVVHPSIPAATVPEFIAYAKAHPGMINVGSAGTGTSQHLAAELFNIRAGIDMTHIPYRGTSPALVDLLGGRLQVFFANPAASTNYVKMGRLRALAVTSSVRVAALPDVPTVAEFLPGFEATLFYGAGVPRSTPAPIIETLNREINAGLADPRTRSRLAQLDGIALGGSPADFARIIAVEIAKWGKVIKLAGVRPD